MKKVDRGFSLIEVTIIMGLTSLAALGTISMIESFRKSTKQMKDLADVNVVSSFIKSQLQQMSGDDCIKYFPAAKNPSIYTIANSDPTQPTTQTVMALVKETNTPTVDRISSTGTSIGGMFYKLVLTTTDNICNSHIGDPKFWCSGTLNLEISRPTGSKSYGLINFSKGYVQDEGYVANILFQVSGSNGAMTSCSYVPRAQSAQIDYGTCTYYATSNSESDYNPDSTKKGALNVKVECPPAYVALTACHGGNCGGAISNILCCRLRNPDQMKLKNPQTKQVSPYWAHQCKGGDPVTGICAGSGCTAPPGCVGSSCVNKANMRCSYVGATILESLCHTVPLSGVYMRAMCKPFEVIKEYCPSDPDRAVDSDGNSCTHPGKMVCCPIER